MQVGYGDGAVIAIHAPAVELRTIDSVGVAYLVVDIHHENRVVGVDVDMIGIIRRRIEHIAVDGLDETFAFRAFFLEINLTAGIALGVHDDGIVLSGGELQKMALARALYKDAPVVVLDEPTAALDAMAESRMYESFDAMVDGRSAVYISHRLSSTRFCDHIALFEDGSIKEYGTHDELMENGGAYARMYEMQSHYYREGEEDEAAV